MKDLEIVTRASADQLAGDLGKMSSMLRAWSKSVERDSPKIEAKPTKNDFDTGKLRAAALHAREHAGALREVATVSKSVVFGLGEIVVASAAAGAGFAMMGAGLAGLSSGFDLVKESVKSASDFEQTRVGFEVMLQSGQKAADMLSDLRKYSSVAPFTNEQVTESARSLLAYGIAADQIIPTIRMLGDISAGLGKNMPLERMTYLYGKTFSTQRAYAVELREFAMGGIPIWDELSKVLGKSVNELEKFAEEGGIGRDEVLRAFINMVSAGGRFNDMVARQGKTLAGLWTTAIDGANLLKRNFGNLVIEEVGLKDVVRDLTNFAGNVDGGLDKLRPMVHLIGDLVKGGAQFVYEFTKAGMVVAEINFSNLEQGFPEFTNSIRSLREVIAGLQDFHFDNKAVKRFALDLFEDVGGSLAMIADFADREGTAFADAFNKNFINPIKDMIQDIRDVRYSLRELVGDVTGAYNMVKKGALGLVEPKKLAIDMSPREAAEWSLTDTGKDWLRYARKEAPNNPNLAGPLSVIEPLIAANAANGSMFPLPRRNMNDEQQRVFLESYRSLAKNIDLARAAVLGGHGNANEALDALVGRRNEILKSFGVGGMKNDLGDLRDDLWGQLNHKLVVEGKLPEIKNEATAKTPQPINALERFMQWWGPQRAQFEAQLYKAEPSPSIASQGALGGFAGVMNQQVEMQNQAKPLIDAFKQVGIASLLAVNPLDRLTGAVARSADEFTKQQALGGVLGGVAGIMSQHGQNVNLPREQGDIPGNLVNLANKLNTEFKLPTKEDIDKYKKELDQLGTFRDKVSGKPLIDPHVAEMAWGKYLTEAAAKFGIGTEVKLANSAVVGSAEDARLLAQFKVQNAGGDTPESLLRLILDFITKYAEEAEKREAIKKAGGDDIATVHLW